MISLESIKENEDKLVDKWKEILDILSELGNDVEIKRMKRFISHQSYRNPIKRRSEVGPF